MSRGTGLTVLEAREAIAGYDAQAQDHAALDAIESRFAEARRRAKGLLPG